MAVRAGAGRRWAARAELALALLGVPALLLATAGVPSWPTWPRPDEIREVLTGPSSLLGGAIARPLVLASWALWLYLALAMGLSFLGHLGGRLGLPLSGRLLVVRDRTVPRALCHLIDAALVVSLAAGPRAGASGWVTQAVAAVARPAVPAAAGAPAPVSEGGGEREHVVAPGESLSEIAKRRCGAAGAWTSIWEANRGREVAPGARLADPDLIRPGWRLGIPEGCGTASGGAYTVRAGDSLWAIAERELASGQRWQEIWELNRGKVVGDAGEVLERPRFIRPGWRLLLPGSPAGGAALADSPPPPTPVPAPAVEAPPPAPESAPPEAAVPAATPAAEASPQPRAEDSAAPTPGDHDEEVRESPPLRIRLPETGALVPASLAAALVAAASLARAQRARRRRTGSPTTARSEGPALRGCRWSGVAPSLDMVGPFGMAVLGAWLEREGAAPAVLAAWEGEESISFLLDAAPDRLPDDASSHLGIRVAFLREGERIVAAASGPQLPLLRRSGLAAADGLLVPVGFSPRGCLHLPLVGPVLGLGGEGAPGVLGSMLVAAGLRAGREDLRILAVGEVALPYLGASSFADDVELPQLERVAPEREEAVREELEAEMARRSRLLVEADAESLAEYLLGDPGFVIPCVLVVVEASRAQEWVELIGQAARLGFGVVALGPLPSPRRIEAGGGTCRVEVEGLERLEGLEAVVLPDSLLEDLAGRPEGDVPAEREEPDRTDFEAPSTQLLPAEPLALPDSPVVSVHCLGPLVVRHGDDEAAPPPGRADVVELFVLLCAHAGRGCTPEEAFAALRPGSNPADERGQVRRWASEARRWLHGNRTNLAVLEKDRGRYRLVLDNVWIDLVAFRSALASARSAEGPREREELLRRAVGLYGGHFCSDRELSWAEGIREELHGLFVDAAAELAGILAEREDLDEALEVLDRAMKLSPHTEELMRTVMRLGLAAGRRDEVARRFERFKAALLVDLGMDPDPDTHSLFHSLMRPQLRRAAGSEETLVEAAQPASTTKRWAR